MTTGASALLIAAVGLTIVYLQARHGGATDEMLFRADMVWYPALNIHYSVGVDGISVAMLLLSAIIVFTGTFASWRLQPLTKEYFLWFTFLSIGVFGFFILDRPVHHVHVLRGCPHSHVSAYRCMGVGTQGVLRHEADTDADGRLRLPAYRYPGYLLRCRSHLYEPIGNSTDAQYSHRTATYLVPAHLPRFRCAGALFPFHTWSPDGHASAPTAVSMLHAGVLMKLGGYGCFRIAMYLMPEAAQELGWIFLILTGISVVYGAFSACVQTDLKYINAYSSVSHCGLVLFAILMMNQTACTGAVLQMLSHGLMTALFFALIGMIYGRTHTR